MKKTEQALGFIGILLVLILGKTLLKTDMLFFRLLMGAGLGYALSRAYTGFAGSVNRAFNTGSTKLMRTLMFLFFITSLLTTAFLFKADPTKYDLWVNPINFGLILGGVLFGFGMSFSSCCASGVLTDLVTGLPRALITLIFFGLGVFLGFPVQNTAGWVKNSWFSTTVGKKLYGGVFLPDLFKWDGLEGYLGALILTAIFCGIVVFIAYAYEKSRKEKNTYTGHSMEKVQDKNETFDTKEYKLLSEENYNRIFAKPWTLVQGAVVISILFALLMGVTKAGWGASTPYGLWFGKFLMIFGVSPETLADFTKMPAKAYALPFFEHGVSVQNFGILLGTAIYLLTAGKFVKTFMSEMHITVRELLLFALGGITMGVGTRFANGCNVGALYTPIANFSLSGWIFLIFMVLGGIVGNKCARKWAK
ncbi:YeeE/YedE family protein [Haloimpatiens massiliensis]|uniref:YeeE/YedE family protein n=1 Tax=Haloimpatiens massiliensis TaxID=1658110 RepID=UPI000C83FA05|nr:YeeE/YedE family protein [Haloimpatiens massiliensis]